MHPPSAGAPASAPSPTRAMSAGSRLVALGRQSLPIRWQRALWRILWRSRGRVPGLIGLCDFLLEAGTSGTQTVQTGVARGLKIDSYRSHPGYVAGVADEAEQAWLADELQPGGLLVDVGANIGFLTMIGSRCVGPEGRVIAIEPDPATGAQLLRNIEMNQLTNVRVVEAAAMADPGSTFLRLSEETTVTNEVTDDAGEGVPVAAVTLDQVLAVDDGRPCLIKIDVEGAEIEVLRGGLATMADRRPTVLCEVHWLGGAFVDFVDQRVVPLGYRAEVVTLSNRSGARPGSRLPRQPVRYHALLRPEEVHAEVAADAVAATTTAATSPPASRPPGDVQQLPSHH